MGPHRTTINNGREAEAKHIPDRLASEQRAGGFTSDMNVSEELGPSSNSHIGHLCIWRWIWIDISDVMVSIQSCGQAEPGQLKKR